MDGYEEDKAMTCTQFKHCGYHSGLRRSAVNSSSPCNAYSVPGHCNGYHQQTAKTASPAASVRSNSYAPGFGFIAEMRK
jgi:hypothetical protein